MNEQLRVRINPDIVQQAAIVCHNLGMTPSQVVSALFAQMVKINALPFRPGEGAPGRTADAPETPAAGPIRLELTEATRLTLKD